VAVTAVLRGSIGRNFRAGLLGIAFTAALLGVAGCAKPPDDPAAREAYDEAADPLEPFNRFMFDVNLAFDDGVFKPVATVYRDVVPEPLRDAFRNLLRNLRSPVILANDLLQGELHRASVTMQRFLLNSTFGFAGLVDLADMAAGLKYHDEDFGQTLGVWGAGEGFFLFLPVLGPSSARDLTGFVVDGLIDPVSYAFGYFDIGYGPPARSVLNALDSRSRAIDTLDDIRRTSIDYYASLRSLYRQKREDDIANGRGTPGRHNVPTLDSPMIKEGDDNAAPSPGFPPATPPAPIVSQSLPALAAAAPAAVPEGAGSQPQFRRPQVDWSAWAPPLVFNPPAVSAQPTAGAVQLAAYQPAAAQPAYAPVPPPSPAMRPAPAQAGIPALAPAQARAPTPARAGAPAGTILFRNGSADLGANDRALLRQFAATALQRGGALRIVGHAGDRTPGLDELSQRFHNFDMSWARATAAAEELERAGLPLQRIVVEAKGETEPVQSAATGDMPGNRRVSIYQE